jgi:hypothetical protein
MLYGIFVITLIYLLLAFEQLAVLAYRMNNVESNIQYHQDVDEMIFSARSGEH